VAVQCDIVGSGRVAQGVVAATESRILFVSKAHEIVFNLSDIDAITRGWRLGRTLTVHSAGERVRMRLFNPVGPMEGTRDGSPHRDGAASTSSDAP
jgi:hypothetical protein